MMEKNITLNPLKISIFSADTVVFYPDSRRTSSKSRDLVIETSLLR